MSFTKLSPALRLGYEPCPKCGGRKVKSENAAAVSGGLKCDHPFHRLCPTCEGRGSVIVKETEWEIASDPCPDCAVRP